MMEAAVPEEPVKIAVESDTAKSIEGESAKEAMEVEVEPATGEAEPDMIVDPQ
jgi:hypothetical protein